MQKLSKKEIRMKQWSEILRNVTMLSAAWTVSYHTASAVSGGLLADCFENRSRELDFHPRFFLWNGRLCDSGV